MEMNEGADRWRDRLSELVDGELDAEEGAELEAHLEVCEECRDVLAELRRVVTHAGVLVDRPPAAELWPGIAERIREEAAAADDATEAPRKIAAERAQRADRARRNLTMSVPQLAAAAVLLVALSSGIAWQVAAGGRTPAASVTAVPTASSPGARQETLLPVAPVATLGYRSAIAQLERALAAERHRLDTATVRKVEEKLALIDNAIEEARQALAADPSNAYLNHYLAGAMRRKLDLLRRTAGPLTEL